MVAFERFMLTSSTPGLDRRAARPMNAPEQDLELVRRLAAGDEDAVRDLYAAFGQRLYAYALRLTDDPAAAEDATQETLVVAWRTAGKFRGEGRLLAWLLGIVHHMALRGLRHRPQPLETLEETAPAPDESPEQRTQAEETRRWVRDGLRDLSPEHRAVLDLVFYQGLTLREVAAVCGIPLGTVKSRLSHARARLRGALGRSREEAPE
jgi:RNA polymerase sigma-70 factor (ECF subfamily)